MIFPVALVTVLFLASSVKAKGKHATGTSSSLRALQACDPSTCDLTGKTYQIAACEEGDCVFSCDDQNMCTTESFDGNGENCNPVQIDCDDDNPETIDSCDGTTGECVHVCDDGNFCTEDSFGEDGVTCVFEIIVCDDENELTIDYCLPYPVVGLVIEPGNCQNYVVPDPITFGVGNEDGFFDQPYFEDAYFFEDEPDLEEIDITRIVEWLKSEVTQERTPFCWRQSIGRGAGDVLTDCPSNKDKLGALCYSPCRSGYSRQGTLDCQQICKDGWRDDGLFCRKAEYGRGAGYPWRFGDSLNDDGMRGRCENANGGSGTCEKYGLIFYPKCQSGFKNFGCCICRPPVPICGNEGYNSPGLDLSCPVKILLGDPTPLICRQGLEQDVALCYPPCQAGFDGVGPVCWQECDTDQVNCGAGCAKTSDDCGLAVADQVLSPLIVAANVATLGASSAPSAGAKTVIIGSKTAYATSKAGYYLLRIASKLQSINPANLAKGATLARRIRLARTGTDIKKIGTAIKVSSIVYSARSRYTSAFAEDFVAQTSQAISEGLEAGLRASPNDKGAIEIAFIKAYWGEIQVEQMAEANGWAIATTVLAAVSIVDITGITGVVSAYAKPICASIYPFPTTVQNIPPSALCKDVTVQVSTESSCESVVPEDAVNNGSDDEDGQITTIVLRAITDGQVTAPGLNYILLDATEASYQVEMIVTDNEKATASCKAKVNVIDPTLPSITCPETTLVNTEPSKCSAEVSYEEPTVTANCFGLVLTAVLSSGPKSGSTFPEGTTPIIFMVKKGDQEEICSFGVSVVDIEPPALSCEQLTTKLENNFRLCSAVYDYEPPVATDNCESVVTAKTEGTEFDDPFPVGTTTTTYEAADQSGNVNSCSFDVLVEDKEAPVLLCDGLPVTNGNDAGQCGAVHVYDAPVCEDNCLVCTTMQTAGLVSTSFFPVGTTTNTFESNDPDDNTSACSFPVEILDVEPATVSCELGVNPGGKQAENAEPGFFKIQAADNCGIASIELLDEAGYSFGDYFSDGDLMKYVDNGGMKTIGDGAGVLDYMIQGAGDLTILVTDIHGNTNTAVCSRGTGKKLRKLQSNTE